MTEETRQKFSLMDLTSAPIKPYSVPFPKEGTIYHYWLIKEEMGRWERWSDELMDIPPIPKDTQFNEIIVPTVDTIRYTKLLELLVTHQKACLFVGPTGTGKSCYIVVSGRHYHLSLLQICSLLTLADVA